MASNFCEACQLTTVCVPGRDVCGQADQTIEAYLEAVRKGWINKFCSYLRLVTSQSRHFCYKNHRSSFAFPIIMFMNFLEFRSYSSKLCLDFAKLFSNVFLVVVGRTTLSGVFGVRAVHHHDSSVPRTRRHCLFRWPAVSNWTSAFRMTRSRCANHAVGGATILMRGR